MSTNPISNFWAFCDKIRLRDMLRFTRVHWLYCTSEVMARKTWGDGVERAGARLRRGDGDLRTSALCAEPAGRLLAASRELLPVVSGRCLTLPRFPWGGRGRCPGLRCDSSRINLETRKNRDVICMTARTCHTALSSWMWGYLPRENMGDWRLNAHRGPTV